MSLWYKVKYYIITMPDSPRFVVSQLPSPTSFSCQPLAAWLLLKIVVRFSDSNWLTSLAVDRDFVPSWDTSCRPKPDPCPWRKPPSSVVIEPEVQVVNKASKKRDFGIRSGGCPCLGAGVAIGIRPSRSAPLRDKIALFFFFILFIPRRVEKSCAVEKRFRRMKIIARKTDPPQRKPLNVCRAISISSINYETSQTVTKPILSIALSHPYSPSLANSLSIFPIIEDHRICPAKPEAVNSSFPGRLTPIFSKTYTL